MNDIINRPPHYTASPSGVECIDVVEHMNLILSCRYLYSEAPAIF